MQHTLSEVVTDCTTEILYAQKWNSRSMELNFTADEWSSILLTVVEHRRRIQNTSHGNEMLPQDTMHLKQRPCYQQGSPRSSRQSDHTKISWPLSSGHLRSLWKNSRTTWPMLWNQCHPHVLSVYSQQSDNNSSTEDNQCLRCVADAGREIVHGQVRQNQKEWQLTC